MSSPTSLKLNPPLYVDPKIRRKFLWMYLVIIWTTLLPASFIIFLQFAPWINQILPFSIPLFPFQIPMILFIQNNIPEWLQVSLLPILFLIIYFITILWSGLCLKFTLWILHLQKPPSEGVFYRDISDKDYLYWNLRNFARIFHFWLLYSTPFTWMKQYFTFSFFGIKIGKNSTINHTWISPEFIEIGSNVIIGQSAGIYSYQFQGDKLLVAKIKIKDRVRIGPQVILLPGTIVNEATIVDGGAFTHPFSNLDADSIYHGCPAQKIQKNGNEVN